ncbi:Uncharacterised protein [Starkeya nomas]|uniref:Uncharacterized protein n=1 Tax=Starkeya nomas TaxID=2666134 RepID=A0A5S9P0B6_9HYPH|nr:hypothetical protein [Starkeya nomas]CAA0096627.1 Uncharacterised protein [Starkeya nomas]
MPHPDRLRHDIDSGRAADKVPFPDPAAAPLGTDEEAAGTPVPVDEVIAARREECRTAPMPSSGTDERRRPYDDRGTSVPGASFPVATAGLLGAVVALGAAAAFLIAS